MEFEDKKEKIIGIVGGMGPQAGLTLFNKLLFHTNAITDQQHLSVVLISFPKQITDRTLFLEGKTKINPAYSIVEIIRKLEITGAEVVGIGCNTSHSDDIYNVITDELYKLGSKIKLVNMPYETCQYIQKKHNDIKRVGVLCTNGTYKTGIYTKILQNMGYNVIIPDYEFQNNVIHKMIYDPKFGVKANPKNITKEVIDLKNLAIEFFKNNRTEVIILGCTELSMVLNECIIEGIQIIDSNECLAKALVREATTKEYKINTIEMNYSFLDIMDVK